MAFAAHKTKIVCTIGPASRSPEVIEQLIHAGMSIARLNFSHDTFRTHKTTIQSIRAAAVAVGTRVAILADLPGPKIRIGQFRQDPILLKQGETFTLTTHDITGDRTRVSVTFARLPQVVKPGDVLFLNDGIIQLEVSAVRDNEIHCQVLVGGDRKSTRLNSSHLGISY